MQELLVQRLDRLAGRGFHQELGRRGAQQI
jgi:hypothetical protein